VGGAFVPAEEIGCRKNPYVCANVAHSLGMRIEEFWLAAYLMHRQNQPPGRKMQPWGHPDPTFESFVQWLE